MTQVGFESMIPVYQRAKTVHALDRAATVIGYAYITCIIINIIIILLMFCVM
jgi:hypothetical protein